MRKAVVVVWLVGGLALAAAAVSTPTARGVGVPPAVADCDLHAQLTRHYSIAELRHALAGIPAEISEYSNCHDIIQHQLLLQLGQLRGGQGAGGGSGGAFLPVWLIVILAVLVAAAVAFGVLALRQRRAG